eukprot:151921_1
MAQADDQKSDSEEDDDPFSDWMYENQMFDKWIMWALKQKGVTSQADLKKIKTNSQWKELIKQIKEKCRGKPGYVESADINRNIDKKMKKLEPKWREISGVEK